MLLKQWWLCLFVSVSSLTFALADEDLAPTRPEMKKRIEALKTRTSRLPLPRQRRRTLRQGVRWSTTADCDRFIFLHHGSRLSFRDGEAVPRNAPSPARLRCSNLLRRSQGMRSKHDCSGLSPVPTTAGIASVIRN